MTSDTPDEAYRPGRMPPRRKRFKEERMIHVPLDPALRRAIDRGEYAVDERAVAEAILRRSRFFRSLGQVLPAGQRVEGRPLDGEGGAGPR